MVHSSVGFLLIGRDIGDQTLLEGNFLYLSCASSDVHEDSIDFLHPDHQAVVHAARQRPAMVELMNPEHGADGLRLALASALGDPERLVDCRQLHVRLAAAVVKKVDPTDRADDPTGPGLWLAAEQGGWAFAGQLFSQTTAEDGILFVEPLSAELVRHCENQFKNRAGVPWNLARWFAFCHVLPSLGLVDASTSGTKARAAACTLPDQANRPGSAGRRRACRGGR